METTDISYISMVVGLLLMAVPIYIFRFFKVPLISSTVIATVRMVVQLFLIGLYLKYLFVLNSPWVNFLWVILMVVVASFTAAVRTRLRRRTILLPLCVGLSASALCVGLYFLFVVLRLANPFDARYFVPIMGILMGNMLTVNVMALNTFYDGIERERQLYYYLLGNGATHLEAVTPFVRRAMEKAFAPCIANMAVMGLVSLPGTMIGQILGGSAPGIAIKYQMMIIVITFSASMLSLVITLFMADRRSFDGFGRLKDVRLRN
ncbi:ABC transporter permease [Xylanibacter muris]|uniref:ABC transporter permease n=1 Tax=Xylanibacter muris TaxID=2736290 RepID=A0ABX2AMG0_9BACT|nr:ABC transporter permease [Xylanibacter muris]NPD92416.1 ABC transporter permease [Xylanibacter muris]